MVVLSLAGCKGKDKPDVPPQPVSVELGIGTITRGTIIQDNKMMTVWGINDVVHFWAKGEELDKPVPFELTWNGSKWVTPQTVDGKKLAKATSIVASYLPKGAGNIVVTPHGFTFTPSPAKDKEVGEFTISQYYTDILVANTGAKMRAITATLQSPYRQVELIIKNSSWTQEVSNISIKIDGAIGEAIYTHEGWKGTSQAITISHKKERWEGSEADTILLAFPTLSQSVSATITYTNSNGEKTETITTDGGSIVFTLVPEEITNPALAFTPPIDVAYWKKANQDAFNLITNNYAGELTEEQARNHGWNQVRPLVDETMCSKQLYKDDMNVIEWYSIMKKYEKSDKRDWGYALGLETLEGTLVEVYPPQYKDFVGGGNGSFVFSGGARGYHYTTVPAGKYRLVTFISYPEEWVGKEEYGKWYKLPMLDAITGFEALNVGGDYRKKYLEPVFMEKSPYKDMDIIEVVDRNENHLVAPRWYMGYIYQDREAYEKNDYLNKGRWSFPKYKTDNIVGVTAVNTTNQQLQGTVVAKVEYLPVFNPIGQWRLDQTGTNHGVSGSFYTSQWSKEVGRTSVTILPNSEQKVAVELTQVDYNWLKLGGRDSARLGPATFIHFYWVDEKGRETMMMKGDYPQLNRMQQLDYGNVNNKSMDWLNDSLWSQPNEDDPARGEGNYANGFIFW
ncbi:hypothetical protein E4P48_03845 [Porphyromonas levii]|nr:hypothetical protein E4P48_03845 [Porphyromonas levii]